MDSIALLQEKIDQFSSDREWEKFHTPKNLSMALSVEAAELMELFQWSESGTTFASFSHEKQEQIKQEIADVLIYAFRFCSVNGIDIKDAIESKLKENNAKYPIDKVIGQAKKYTEI